MMRYTGLFDKNLLNDSGVQVKKVSNDTYKLTVTRGSDTRSYLYNRRRNGVMVVTREGAHSNTVVHNESHREADSFWTNLERYANKGSKESVEKAWNVEKDFLNS